MAFVVDRFLPTDLAAGLRLSTQAGWNQVAADWQRVVDLCPAGCLAGRLDGRLVATGSVAAIGPKIRWIGLILVDEAARGRGFGSIMMDRCLELARRNGDEVVALDASDLGRPVYLKKGFVDVIPIDRWTGVLAVDGNRGADRIGLDAFGELARLDREACGVDRSELLKDLLEDRDGHCFGSTGPGGLDGFAVLLPGRTSPHLGPVIARDDDAFKNLLGAAARRLGSTPVILDSLRTPENSLVLEQAGLTVSRRLTRMTLGQSHPVLMGPMVRAAVSFTWG
jgi:GNAT superfamily N-acetyltransferase